MRLEICDNRHNDLSVELCDAEDGVVFDYCGVIYIKLRESQYTQAQGAPIFVLNTSTMQVDNFQNRGEDIIPLQAQLVLRG